MMNKKLFVSMLVLAVVFMLGSFVQAKEYIATADFNDMDPKVIHDSPRVDTVISCNMVLKPRTQAHFSRLCSSAVSNVKYYFNNSETSVEKGPDYTDIVDNEVFYPASNRIPRTYIGGTISYKVGCDFQTKKSNGEKIYKDVPEDSYQTAVIISSITKQVDLGVATEVSVPTGDQSKPNWVKLSPVYEKYKGILYDYVFYFGDDDENENVSYVSSVKVRKSSQRETVVKPDVKGDWFDGISTEVDYSDSLVPTLIFGDGAIEATKSAKYFIMQYCMDENKNWINCPDEQNKRIKKEIKKNSVGEEEVYINHPSVECPGYYRILAVDYSADSGTCRPVRRTIVKGRIGTRYPGFEFPNLVEGDVVKIFSVNGKKIAEVSGDNSGKIVWNGRKDNGDWAKSGIYIYQIKVKETGKLISGTIVFVY